MTPWYTPHDTCKYSIMDIMWFFDRQARRRATRFIIGEFSHKVAPLNLTISLDAILTALFIELIDSRLN
jgi:hypothetical protein